MLGRGGLVSFLFSDALKFKEPSYMFVVDAAGSHHSRDVRIIKRRARTPVTRRWPVSLCLCCERHIYFIFSDGVHKEGSDLGGKTYARAFQREGLS